MNKKACLIPILTAMVAACSGSLAPAEPDPVPAVYSLGFEAGKPRILVAGSEIDLVVRNSGPVAEDLTVSLTVPENDGEYLTFTGWVFSVRPAEDGWYYDAASRTGWIRLRVTGGIPASEAEAWAHENIAEIVKYKNAVLEPGKAPPPGAAFRSLGEKFEDGILTIEFEAVQ